MAASDQASPKARKTLCFGSYELDVRAGELRKRGIQIKLQRQPIQVLIYLAERAGEVVTREELQSALWPSDTFVDFEQGLNRSINKIRAALSDDAVNPRFIETLSRKGYRFLASVAVDPALPNTSPLEFPAVPVSDSPVESKGFSRFLWPSAIAALAAAVAFASLWAWNRSKPQPGLHVQSLAVLPLQNLSGDPSQEYFADGMTDELITQLAKIGSIRVISRTSAMRYKDTRKSLPEVARELNVDAVVEGSVVHSGNRVRLTAQLIEAPTDRHLWAESYERDFRDIVPLQADLARAIASQISAELATGKNAGQSSARAVDAQAQEAYFQGRYYLNQTTAEALTRSLAYFEEAIARDPNYAEGYAGLADTCVREIYVGRSAAATFPKAKMAAEKALQLDDSLAEAHAVLGLVEAAYEHDWTGAEKEFRRAIELNPGSTMGHHYYVFGLTPLGRREDAIAENNKALSLDPLSPVVNLSLADTLFYARKYDESFQQFKRTVELEPNFLPAHVRLMSAYEEKAMYPEALAEFERVAELSGYSSGFIKDINHAYESSGVAGYYQMRLRFIEQSGNKENLPTEAAIVYARIGDTEHALQFLEKGVAEHEMLATVLNVEPAFDSLHSNPRFEDLVRRMNLAAEATQPVKVAAGDGSTSVHALLGTNLIVNPGAEDGPASTGYEPPASIPGWTRTAGAFTVEPYGGPNGLPDLRSPGPAERGKNLFAGGHNAPFSSGTQSIDISAAASLIDAKKITFTLSGFLGGFHNQGDTATLKAVFHDAKGKPLSASTIGPVTVHDRKSITALLLRHATGAVPPGTRTVTLELSMKRVDPYYNDGYADNLSLVLNAR
jgi:TolB-like protein/DNA-binding winged helix-turn-helix (wHTH) protein/Tfp pilus assembly protein PilF